jgi:hypothetical protein
LCGLIASENTFTCECRSLTFVSENFYQLIYLFDILNFNVNIFQVKDSVRWFVNAVEKLSCPFFIQIWTYFTITWEQRHFRYRRVPCQPSHTYAVLPRAVLISTFPPFLICVHTKNWWHSDEGIHICRRQGCNAAWNQFSSLQIKKSCGHIFDTVFFLFRVTFKCVNVQSSMKELNT